MSEIDIFNQYPLHIDPQTKSISLPQSSAYTPTQITAINAELQELNDLHRSFLSIEGPAGIPPPPLPVNPKRSAQITKLRDSANATYRKGNHVEAVRLYTYAIDMALSRPGWEPVTSPGRNWLVSLETVRRHTWRCRRGRRDSLMRSRVLIQSLSGMSRRGGALVSVLLK
ncbi:hypothetical protein N7526_006070 [Penicillium atrosanguineum]|nr:hypothetical protein N7526_006070 [Penicillium atrosanguineum]